MSKRNADAPNGDAKKQKIAEMPDCGFGRDPAHLEFSYPPDEMRIYVQEFQEFVPENKKNKIKHLEKLATEWAEKKRTEDGEIVDVAMFCTDYRKYLKSAVRVSNLQLSDSALITERFLSKKESLKMFADFPTRPIDVVQIYINKKKPTGGINEIAEAFKTESADVIDEINGEHMELEEAYCNDLATFLDNHPDLTESQMNWIHAKIDEIEERIEAKAQEPPKEPETAFTIWARIYASNWLDLSETDRHTMLMEKFTKLSNAEFKLLAEIAMTY